MRVNVDEQVSFDGDLGVPLLDKVPDEVLKGVPDNRKAQVANPFSRKTIAFAGFGRILLDFRVLAEELDHDL